MPRKPAGFAEPSAEMIAHAEARAESLRESPPDLPVSLGDRLGRLVGEQVSIELQLEALEDERVRLQALLDDLKRRQIPDIVTQSGMPEISALVGNQKYRVSVENKIYGSLNYAPDEATAVEYLEELGYDGAVLTRLSVDFTEAERKAAASLKAKMEKALKGGRSVQIGREIHSSTYRAFVRRALEDHPELKPEVLGITIVREAKITPVK